MTRTANDVAHYLGNLASWQLSNLQLQKIIYMADMNLVGQGHGRLVDEDFEAWAYGPVLRGLYHQCKAFGSKPVPNIFWGASNISGSKEAEMLKLAWDKLKDKTPGQLVQITHWQDGAWAKRYKARTMCIPISTQDMIDEYRARRAADVARKSA